mgnify:CR=1 FL=1
MINRKNINKNEIISIAVLKTKKDVCLTFKFKDKNWYTVEWFSKISAQKLILFLESILSQGSYFYLARKITETNGNNTKKTVFSCLDFVTKFYDIKWCPVNSNNCFIEFNGSLTEDSTILIKTLERTFEHYSENLRNNIEKVFQNVPPRTFKSCKN